LCPGYEILAALQVVADVCGSIVEASLVLNWTVDDRGLVARRHQEGDGDLVAAVLCKTAALESDVLQGTGVLDEARWANDVCM